jgi:hypothetical protein
MAMGMPSISMLVVICQSSPVSGAENAVNGLMRQSAKTALLILVGTVNILLMDRRKLPRPAGFGNETYRGNSVAEIDFSAFPAASATILTSAHPGLHRSLRGHPSRFTSNNFNLLR